MCIRDRWKQIRAANNLKSENIKVGDKLKIPAKKERSAKKPCLLYTSDAADERSSVDLGGRRIIKKTTSKQQRRHRPHKNITNTHATRSHINENEQARKNEKK